MTSLQTERMRLISCKNELTHNFALGQKIIRLHPEFCFAFNAQNLNIGGTRPLWLNSYRGEKKEAQEVHRYQRGKSGIQGRAGDASAGQAC